MFVVKPLDSKETQENICKALSVPYEAEAMAYFAANLAPDRETITDIIGICQFTLGEPGKIITLACAPSFTDDEAMIVLCRAVMYFMHRIGIQRAEMLPDAGPAEILSQTGFLLRDGIYQMDLETFYQAPCKYEKE